MNCFTVNDTARRELIHAIQNLVKTEETRTKNTLSRLVGQRVGLVENINGNKRLVMMVTIGKPVEYRSAAEFEAAYNRHRIGAESRWFKTKGVGYPLLNVEPVEPVEISNDMIKARHGYSWFSIS